MQLLEEKKRVAAEARARAERGSEGKKGPSSRRASTRTVSRATSKKEKCLHCSAPLRPGSVFCNKCGKPQKSAVCLFVRCGEEC